MNRDIYNSALQHAVLRDMSHFGRFRVGGADGGALLHHLTTNDIKSLKPGQGCDAALVTNKARLLDLLTVFRQEKEFLVVTSPNRRDLFKPHAAKFIVYRQEIRVEDVTAATGLWGLFGLRVPEILASLGASAVLDAAPNEVRSFAFDETLIHAARTSRLPFGGVFLWSDDAKALERALRETKVPLCDSETYNLLRIEAGIPVAGLELTEEINPWEAGLDAAISLHKGCYNGQEVIARLNTYKKVKQGLRGLKLEAPLPMGERANLEVEGRSAGFTTSSAVSPRFGPIALAYVRGDYQATGQKVDVVRGEERQTVTVADLPFSD